MDALERGVVALETFFFELALTWKTTYEEGVVALEKGVSAYETGCVVVDTHPEEG